MSKQIMVHYGELTTKGKNRKAFTNKLAENIRFKTKEIDPDMKINIRHDFILLNWTKGSYHSVIEQLKQVPGIPRFEPTYPTEKTLNAMAEKALELFKAIDIKPGDTFRVVAKRSDKQFPHSSMEVGRMVGGAIGRAYPEMSVDLKHGKHKLVVHIHHKVAYLSLENFAGLGGFPYGIGGRGMLMLSGGFDSPVAGYELMRRGMEIEAVHFSSPPYTSPQALEKTKKLAAKISEYGMPMTFHNVPFTAIQEAIKEHVPDDLSMTVMRRMMVRITDALASNRKALALVTGESLGQVASQTLESMYAINAVTSTPILRPLIATDKNDIIQLAKQIGTHDLSNEPFEDCCTVFAPRSPRTKPSLQSAEEVEAVLNEAVNIQTLIDEAVQGVETSVVDASYLKQTQESFVDLL